MVGLIGVGAAAWFFLRSTNMLVADVELVGFLLLGEIGGRAAAYVVERWQSRH